MGDDYFGFHGYFRSTRTLADAELDAAAEAVGLTATGPEPRRHSRSRGYEAGVCRSISAAVSDEKVFSQFGVFGVTVRHILHRGPDTFATLVTSLARRCDAILVRSFFPAVAEALVGEDELGGEVAHLDWYQYGGPTIVARWGMERLEQGPFYRVETLPNGACVIWMGSSPFWMEGDPSGGRVSRKAAVEYLGIHPRLRPLH